MSHAAPAVAPRGIAVLLAALAAIGPFSIDTYLPPFTTSGNRWALPRCRCNRP